MIGFLRGKITYKNTPYIYIDVHGVGYKVLVANSILSNLPISDEEIIIFTYTYVREDILELFGFLKQEDLKIFELLISVSGVGPKTAMNIFSFGTGDKITKAISSSDVDFFTNVPRLGKKNAQKIIIELKNKVSSNEELNLSSLDPNRNDELILALKSIGFQTNEIQEAVKKITNPDASLEEKIKLALKNLSK